MKEHLLSPNDRAALQSLVPLASALGAGTIFALFFGGRRRTEFAIFEVFAIAAVLTAVGTTAYLAVALLHRGQAISDQELTQTATPLIIATLLLLLISIFSRLPPARALTVLPFAIAAAVVAAEIAVSSPEVTPDDASLFALLILGVGVLLGGAGWAFDLDQNRRARRSPQRELARLTEAGLTPVVGTLRLEVPRRPDEAAPVPPFACWTRKERLFTGFAELQQLRRTVDARWQSLASGEGLAATGERILLRLRVEPWIPGIRSAPAVSLVAFEPADGGREVVHELPRNEEGLFEVTPFVAYVP